jgi:hypothetical protein
MTDRRRCPRRPAAGEGWTRVRVCPGRDAVLVDLGAGGALVECRSRLLPGSTVLLQFIAPGRTVTVRGRVVRCEVTALDPAHGVRYRGAVSFDEDQPGLTTEGQRLSLAAPT